MTDLRARLRSADSIPTPTDWPDLDDRPPRELPPERRHRVLSAAVAIAVFLASAGLAVWAFRGATSNVGGAARNGRIAFVRSPGFGVLEKGSVWIYVVQPDGSGLHRLVNGVQPAWSPDGTHIAFLQQVSPAGIFIANADGTGIRRLTTCSPPDCEADMVPAWSPDGRQVAFVRSLRPGGDTAPELIGLWVVNADGTGLRQLVGCGSSPNCVEAVRPSWSPEGTRIAYTSGTKHSGRFTFQIEVLDLATGEATPIYACPSCNLAPTPAWSPDGATIAADLGGSIYTMHPDGSHLVRLTECGDGGQPCSDRELAWSPDGALIAFTRNASPPLAGGQEGIYVMRADGSALHQLTRPLAGEGDGSPAWAAAAEPAPSPTGSGGPTEASPTSYSVEFGEVQPTGEPGTYTIPVQTNLPDGTIVYADYESTYLGGGGTGNVVEGGVLDLKLVNNGCAEEGGILVSPPTTNTITVAWGYRAFMHGGGPMPSGFSPPSPTSAQPASVLAILGQGFENLEGPQVSQVDGNNELVASQTYQLPADTCTVKFLPGPNNDYSTWVAITPPP